MFPKEAVQLLSCKRGRDCQDGGCSACEVIDTGTVKVIERDETVRALEVVWYVPKARYNLIYIGVLNKKGCQIQVQQGGVTVSQGDRVIAEGEKYEGLYKLKETNSVRSGVSGIILEGNSSRGEDLRKTTMGREPGQSVAGRRKGAFG